MPTDVHQHIWPPDFIELLRSRTTPPHLDGWTLHAGSEPPYEVDPADHDIAARTRLAATDGLGLALVSLSSPSASSTCRPPRPPRCWRRSTTAPSRCRPPSAYGPLLPVGTGPRGR